MVIEMSTGKVSTNTSVGHSTNVMAKLGNIASSRVSASVAGVSDSSGTGSSTDQYLLNEQTPMFEKPQSATVEPSLIPMMEAGLVLETNLRFGDGTDSYLSLREAGQQLESYEKTMEAYEDKTPKKTQGFG